MNPDPGCMSFNDTGFAARRTPRSCDSRVRALRASEWKPQPGVVIVVAALAVTALGAGRVAVIDNTTGSAEAWCGFLITNHYECTVLPASGPPGPLGDFDVVIDLSNTWADPDGLLADHMRAGKGVITVRDAPMALGLESNPTVQAWIGANATTSVSWTSLVTTDTDELLGTLPPETFVGHCHQFDFCGALSDTTGHTNAKIVARFDGGSGPIGILRNSWEGGQSVFMSGVSYGTGELPYFWPMGAEIVFRAVGVLSSFPEGCFDFDDDGIPDLCCFPSSKPELLKVPNVSGHMVTLENNRYLSFSAGDPGRTQAIRVRLYGLPGAHYVWEGATMWVGAPRQVSENGGAVDPIPGFPSFTAATLTCEPFYTDWSSLGTIHASHEGVVPGAWYAIDVLDDTCSIEVGFSVRASLTTPTWGDVAGPFDGAADLWTAADGTVDLNDAVAILTKFVSAPHAPSKPRCDLEPACPDLLINMSDVLFAVTGFQGIAYPFEPSAPDPCDSPCPSPFPR